ncbi:MAG: hypothetical protein RKP20_10390 [Candidatus Competibacter sp.]|nr:hypothetical protein [Candidatus Competibacter sp.]
MRRDGKKLEALVAFVEQALVPKGFNVETNERVFNDEGIQIAEFDVKVEGKVGSTDISWLIECRDRPAEGPAPGSWIEQLVGRRTRFRFNKITAVSTTGFAIGAADFAKEAGIETRVVESLAPEHFPWVVIQELPLITNTPQLCRAYLLLAENATDEEREALSDAIRDRGATDRILEHHETRTPVSGHSAFFQAIQELDNAFDGIEPNGPGRDIRLDVRFVPGGAHYVVQTSIGPLRIDRIIFEGSLLCHKSNLPITVAEEYRDNETGQIISQFVAFEPQRMMDVNMRFEMHKLSETGETHVILRGVK